MTSTAELALSPRGWPWPWRWWWGGRRGGGEMRRRRRSVEYCLHSLTFATPSPTPLLLIFLWIDFLQLTSTNHTKKHLPRRSHLYSSADTGWCRVWRKAVIDERTTVRKWVRAHHVQSLNWIAKDHSDNYCLTILRPFSSSLEILLRKLVIRGIWGLEGGGGGWFACILLTLQEYTLMRIVGVEGGGGGRGGWFACILLTLQEYTVVRMCCSS